MDRRFRRPLPDRELVRHDARCGPQLTPQLGSSSLLTLGDWTKTNDLRVPAKLYSAMIDDRQLQVYAELAVRVALNVQPGQRVMIIGASLANGGALLEAAPLARQIAAAAYRAGSPLVETIYGDERQLSMRLVLGAEVRRTRHQSDAWTSRGTYLGQRPKREPSRHPVFGQSSNGRSVHNCA
jgi:hypothetical protein